MGPKSSIERFPLAPLLPPSQSLTTTLSPCTPTHGAFPTSPTTAPFSISNHHTVTLPPYPQTFVPVSRGCTPPSPHISTHKDDDKGTSTHQSPPTHIPPFFFLLPPLPLAPKVGRVCPFHFARSLYVLWMFPLLHTTSMKISQTACRYVDLHLCAVCWCVWWVCRRISGLVGWCIVMFLGVSYVFMCVCVCVCVGPFSCPNQSPPTAPPPPRMPCFLTMLARARVAMLCSIVQ